MTEAENQTAPSQDTTGRDILGLDRAKAGGRCRA